MVYSIEVSVMDHDYNKGYVLWVEVTYGTAKNLARWQAAPEYPWNPFDYGVQQAHVGDSGFPTNVRDVLMYKRNVNGLGSDYQNPTAIKTKKEAKVKARKLAERLHKLFPTTTVTYEAYPGGRSDPITVGAPVTKKLTGEWKREVSGGRTRYKRGSATITKKYHYRTPYWVLTFPGEANGTAHTTLRGAKEYADSTDSRHTRLLT